MLKYIITVVCFLLLQYYALFTSHGGLYLPVTHHNRKHQTRTPSHFIMHRYRPSSISTTHPMNTTIRLKRETRLLDIAMTLKYKRSARSIFQLIPSCPWLMSIFYPHRFENSSFVFILRLGNIFKWTIVFGLRIFYLRQLPSIWL